jgi:hypothetical protein
MAVSTRWRHASQLAAAAAAPNRKLPQPWALSPAPAAPAAPPQASGEHAIKAEIAARGPIACSLCATDEFEAYAGGVFRDATNCTEMNHSIEIAGWGEEQGERFWVGRNSWGTYWWVGGRARCGGGGAALCACCLGG